MTTARGILWIALAVRKLSEAGELSFALQRRCWPVGFHPRRPGTPVSRAEPTNAYAIEFTREDSLSTLRLCGLLIHCSVFASTAEGVYFTSHIEQQDGLFFLDWSELGRVVEAVCDDDAGSGVIRAA